MRSISEQMTLIRRGVVDFIGEEELETKLGKGKKLLVKTGFDPTAPDLHLGHTVLLRKMRHFQDCGHQVCFLIGDFTATIGDPSGRSKGRKRLSFEEVLENAKTYEKQIYPILDRSKTIVRFNSEWCKGAAFSEVLELASHYTVARLIERDDFSKRLQKKEPLSVLELLYPLIQGWDSVKLEADVELGGTDQKFNLLVGRELQRRYGQSPQSVLTLPLIEGTDGVHKMSKSLGNTIGLEDAPNDMFGKAMSIPDSIMLGYFELLTDVPEDSLASYRKEMEQGKNPMNYKRILARELVCMYHSKEHAKQAELHFDSVVVNKQIGSDYEILKWKGGALLELVYATKNFKSKSEAIRLIRQGGVQINQRKVTDPNLSLEDIKTNYFLKVGKRKFYEIEIG